MERLRGLRRRPAFVLIAAFVVAWSGSALAITDEEIFREFAFNFAGSGARSLGMGGAFVGLADDVTAAQANPAGLATFAAPQFYIEYGMFEQDVQVVGAESGSLEVDLNTGDRDLPFFGAQFVSDIDTQSEPTFVGGAWPILLGSAGRTFTLGASRQVVLSEERSLTSGNAVTETRFAFDTFPNTVNGGMIEAYSINTPVSGGISNEIVHWNFSVALDAHPDFTVGVTLTAAELDLKSTTLTRISDPLELFVDPAHPRLPSQPTTDLYTTTINSTDSDLVYTIGILWHPDSVFTGGSSPWQFGAVYRKGAEFDLRESIGLNGLLVESFSTPFIVPDRAAVGMSYRHNDRLLVTAEVERIEYSDLLEGLRSGVNYFTSDRVADGAFAVDPDEPIAFDIDDGIVPRVGVEFTRPIGEDGRLALRAGYRRMPDDRLRMVGFNAVDADVNSVYLKAFRGGDETDHVTGGAGYEFGRSTVQIGGSFSDEETVVIGSYNFSLTGR